MGEEAEEPGFVALLVPLVYCATPWLVAAIVATGVGAWLPANRLFLGSGLALALSVIALGVLDSPEQAGASEAGRHS